MKLGQIRYKSISILSPSASSHFHHRTSIEHRTSSIVRNHWHEFINALRYINSQSGIIRNNSQSSSHAPPSPSPSVSIDSIAIASFLPSQASFADRSPSRRSKDPPTQSELDQIRGSRGFLHGDPYDVTRLEVLVCSKH